MAANLTFPLNQDPASKYYIHPSDANSTQLVSIKFDGTGFANWKRTMKLSLSATARNKLGFVNGKFTKPKEGTLEFEAWERCNDLVSTWIINNLEKTISQSVLFLKTALDIWNNLEMRFGFVVLFELFSLEQKLAVITQGTSTIAEYFTEIKMVWDAREEVDPFHVCVCEQCTCNTAQKNQARQERKILLQFMIKLKEDYSTIRGNILMMKPTPGVTKAYRIFAQEESHKNVSATTQEIVAFYADKRRFSDSRNGRQGYPPRDSYVNQRPQAQSYMKKNERGGPALFCTHCKRTNHTVDKCYRLHGFPNDWNKGKKMAAAVVTEQEGDVNQTVEISTEQYNQFKDFMKTQSQAGHSGSLFDDGHSQDKP